MVQVLKKIILVDDHLMFTEGIKMMLNTFRVDSEVFCTSSIIDAEHIIKEKGIDLAIVDINMPEKNGIDFIVDLKDKGFINLKTIILTSEEDPAILEKAINANVDGILLKDVGGKELLQALVDIAEGKIFYGSGIAAKLIKAHSSNDQDVIYLSTRELEILRLFCEELSSNEIAEKLDISVHTVDSHRKNIMRKTGVKGMIGLYKWALSNNLIDVS